MSAMPDSGPQMTVEELTRFGRTRLSASFFMRDFLYSEIAAVHGLPNIPDDPDLAIAAGTRLCEEILEPLQHAFGRITIRSAYRSAALNALGHAMTMRGRPTYGCASNRKKNAARHIWDLPDEKGYMGATACIVVPSFWQRYRKEGDWQKLAWWIHDHLPYSHMTFFGTRFAFNIGWHEQPARVIESKVTPEGTLTRAGYANHSGSHESAWHGILTS
jgi:hypothetical protein